MHNVVYVATLNDTVYAFDANSGSLPALWTTSLLDYSPPGATPVPIAVTGCAGTTAWTQIGVISTPVIDPIADVIYLLAETYENEQAVHRLHALDVTSGMEAEGWPITIQASCAGTPRFWISVWQNSRWTTKRRLAAILSEESRIRRKS